MSTLVRPLFAALVVALALPTAADADTVKVEPGQSIQAVIESGQLQAGDTLKLGKGTYREVIRIPPELPVLTIQGKGAVLQALPNGSSAGAAITVEADGVTISGLTILHANDGENPSGGSISGYGVAVLANGFRGEKLKILRTRGVSIEGNGAELDRVTVLATDGIGIDVTGDGAKITGCRVEAASEAGVSLNGNDLLLEKLKLTDVSIGVLIHDSEDVTVRNVRIARAAYGVLSQAVTDLLVEKSSTDQCLVGIVSTGNYLPFYRNLDIRRSSLAGISSDGDIFPSILDCRVREVSGGDGSGLLLTDVLGQFLNVSGNRINGVTGTAIKVESELGELAVRFNVINGCTVGIDFKAGSRPILQGNVIRNARVLGLRVEGENAVLFENSVTKGSGNGIRIAGQVASLAGNKVISVLGEGIQNFAEACTLQDNKVIKTGGSPLTDAAMGAELIDDGGNLFGDSVVAGPGTPVPAIDF